MSPPPSLPQVERVPLSRYNVPLEDRRTWYSSQLYEAEDAFKNAQSIFPEQFQGEETVSALIVTPIIHDHILQSQLGEYLVPSYHERWNCERRYKVGEYVGKVMHYSVDPSCESSVTALFTPTSYPTYETAMFEACTLALDATKTALRHILYSITPPMYHYEIDFKVDLICNQGILPRSPVGRSSSGHEPASSPHPAE